MSNLYLYTLFDQSTKLPRCTGIKDGDRIVMVDLYRPGEKKKLSAIFKRLEAVHRTILLASSKGRPIILSDFKAYVKAFNLPHDPNIHYNVYDLHLPDVKSISPQQDHAVIRKVLAKMGETPIREYQKIIANAAIVYQDLEDKGLFINYGLHKPQWSQKTFSGRSKTTGFNIQGYAENERVRPITMPDNSLLIHFDWICADIRVASILSGDEALQEAFDSSDPYQVMMEELNKGSDEKISRDECKTYLLKSINSMDFGSVALDRIYPQLGFWIGKCRQIMAKNDGYLETLLKRRFRRSRAKNDLAVLNGVMQGSVAHAMQLCIRRIWEAFPEYLIAEIHDSLVISCYPTHKHVSKAVDTVAEIMLHPFAGVLHSNPAFPLKVSVGKCWKEWKPLRIYREDCVINVQEAKRETPPDGQEKGCGKEAQEESEEEEKAV